MQSALDRRIGISTRLKEVFEESQAVILTEVISEAYEDLSDFNELKAIVKELAQAQKRTEIRVEELANAQKRTELRLEELAQAQKRTELRLEELAQAQKETQKEIGRLDRAIEELAHAQKRTEEALCKLTKEHTKTREQVGGLSMTVGYRLEDEAFKALPGLLKRDFGITTEGKINRRYIKDSTGRFIEVNILGEATQNGKKIIILGEAKSQLSKKDVDAFIKRKLDRLKDVYEEIFPVLVTYMTTAHDVEEYARNKGVAIYYSYDF